MKKSTHNVFEPVDKQHYKKSYIKRKLEEKEASDEIRQFRQSGGQEEVPQAPSMDAKRPM